MRVPATKFSCFSISTLTDRTGRAVGCELCNSHCLSSAHNSSHTVCYAKIQDVQCCCDMHCHYSETVRAAPELLCDSNKGHALYDSILSYVMLSYEIAKTSDLDIR